MLQFLKLIKSTTAIEDKKTKKTKERKMIMSDKHYFPLNNFIIKTTGVAGDLVVHN